MRERKGLISFLLASILLGNGTGFGQLWADEAFRPDNLRKEAPLQARRPKGSPLARDPFLLPSGVKPLSQASPPPQSAQAPPLPSLELKAILLSDRVRLASVNHQIVTIGDLVHGERVTQIEADRVVLEKEGKKRTLLLPQSAVRLKVDTKRGKEKR